MNLDFSDDQKLIQLHGGVRYTYLFYRRARLLGVALGGASRWRDRLFVVLAQGATTAH